jgi:hypothetical protein
MWEDNIRMDLRKTGQEVVDWIHVAHDSDQWQALVNMVRNLRFHKRRELLDYLSYYYGLQDSSPRS